MRDTDIKDSDIPGADPAAVVAQYEPLVMKLAKRYISILATTGAIDMDDLMQAGRMAILQAQPRYDPAGGASFLSFVINPIRWALLRAIGYNAHTNTIPEPMIYLDAPITDKDGNETARIELIEDLNIQPFDEKVIEDENAQEIRAAVSRLRSKKQAEIIDRVYFRDQSRAAAAADMGISYNYLTEEERTAKRRLRHDQRLYEIAMPYFSVGIGAFKRRFTSAVEAAVIWREEHSADY